MSGKALKLDDVEINKKEFHASKQPISLDLANVNKILISDKLNIIIKILSILLVTKKILY